MPSFEANLREQLSLLSDYADLYDNGKFGHAKSIATRIYATLEMLGSKDGAAFTAGDKKLLLSNYYRPLPHSKTHGHHPLTNLSVSMTVGEWRATAMFHPKSDKPGEIQYSKLISIGEWKKEAVIVSTKGHSIKRYDLYSQMRNKDGGAHAPSEPEPSYLAAADPFGIGLTAMGPQGRVPYDPPGHFATVRHMAYELLNSPRLKALN